MKNQTRKKLITSRPLLNQLLVFLQDKGFLNLVSEQRKSLKIGSVSSRVSCKKAIRAYLLGKELSENWVQPIYSFISKEEFDTPLEGGLSLKVGGQEVTSNGEFLLIQDKDGRLMGENTISIVISAKLSIDRIINFVKENQAFIEAVQEKINLPKYEPINWKDLELGMKIIQMRDDEGLSFQEIENKLSNEKAEVRDYDKVPDQGVIKVLYHRYKKRLSQK